MADATICSLHPSFQQSCHLPGSKVTHTRHTPPQNARHRLPPSPLPATAINTSDDTFIEFAVIRRCANLRTYHSTVVLETRPRVVLQCSPPSPCELAACTSSLKATRKLIIYHHASRLDLSGMGGAETGAAAAAANPAHGDGAVRACLLGVVWHAWWSRTPEDVRDLIQLGRSCSSSCVAGREQAAPNPLTPLPRSLQKHNTQHDSVAIAQLREQLTAALAEKEQLQQDIATLCEARATGASSMFGTGAWRWACITAAMQPHPSVLLLACALTRIITNTRQPRTPATPPTPGYLVSQGASSLKQDNALLRQQLKALAAERDNLREDIAQFRDSKHQSDKGWKEAQARAGELEKELLYYRASNARAITARCVVARARALSCMEQVACACGVIRMDACVQCTHIHADCRLSVYSYQPCPTLANRTAAEPTPLNRDTAVFETDQLRDRATAAQERATTLAAQLESERAVRQQQDSAIQQRRATAAAGEAAALLAEKAKGKALAGALKAMEESRDQLKVELLAAQAASAGAAAAQAAAERGAEEAEGRAAAAEAAAAEAGERAAAAEERARELEASASDLTQQAAQAKEQTARARAQAAVLQKQLNQQSARENDLATTLEQLTAALVAAQAGLKELQQQQAAAWRTQEQGPPAGAGVAAGGGGGGGAADAPSAAAAADGDGKAQGAALRSSSCASDGLAGADSFTRREHQLQSLQQELEEREAMNAALQEHCNHLKERLADAVREKVEALLLAADATTVAAGERIAAAAVIGERQSVAEAAAAVEQRAAGKQDAAAAKRDGGNADQSPKAARGAAAGPVSRPRLTTW